jgi:hypothetical protein
MDSPDLRAMNEIIARFCADVVLEPLSYFSEADLQSLLFMRLATTFPKSHETSVLRGPGSKGRYRTSRVHREYGAGDNRRLDLCVFSQTDVESIDRPTLMAKGKYLSPEFAVEIGTEKTVDATTHIASDLRKLAVARTRGYLLHFFRDPTVADLGTLRRDRTEARLDRVFRQPSVSIRASPNVVYLCFVLRIRRSSGRIWGKCELFGSGERTWSKISTARVEGKVREALEIFSDDSRAH